MILRSNTSQAAEPGAGAWERVHARLAAEDAARSAWLDSVVRFDPKCIAAGRKRKGTGVNSCANGCGAHVHKKGPCARCRYGDEVKFCEDGCGASWRRGDMPLRKACPKCAVKRKHTTREQREQNRMRENVTRAA